MICSTLSGKMAIKHPTTGVLVREDGMVLNSVRGGHGKKCAWTKGYLQKDGYRTVRILGKDYKVHRLLAEAFLQNPENKPTVDHINRIRDDNRVCNLRWATYKEQQENSGSALNRVDYGVRWCENRLEYGRVRARLYREAHRDEILARKKEYYKAHRDEIRAKQHTSYQANREERLSYAHEYRKAHIDERMEYDKKRYEKKKQDKLAEQERV